MKRIFLLTLFPVIALSQSLYFVAPPPLPPVTATDLYFYGDSVFAGQGATTHAQCGAALLSVAMGATEHNSAVGGQAIAQGLGSASFNVATLVTKPGSGTPKLIVNWGLNDSSLATLQNFQDSYALFISTALSKGWSISDIIIVTGFYYDGGAFGSEPTEQYMSYVTWLVSYCISNSIRYITNFPSYAQGDTVHPTDAGYVIVKNWMYANLTGTIGSYDWDVLQFLTASGITDQTIKDALNVFVLAMKSNGVAWQKAKAIYPFVGGTSSTHSYNLKNPLRFQITWTGGLTHSATGVLPNGTTGYGATGLGPGSRISRTIGGAVYIRTDAKTDLVQVDLGSADSNGQFWLSAWYHAGGFNDVLARNTSASVLLDGGVATASKGFFCVEKIGTTNKLYKNAVIIDSDTDAASMPSISVYIGANNVNSSAASFSNRELSYVRVSDSFSDSEVSVEYSIVQVLQTTLSRSN